MSPTTASALIQWNQRVGTSHATYSLYSVIKGLWLRLSAAYSRHDGVKPLIWLNTTVSMMSAVR